MNRKSRRVLFFFAVCAISPPAFSDTPISLTPVHRAGEKMDWIQSSNLLTNMLPVGVRSRVSEQITDVLPDGSYSVLVTQGKSYLSWAFEDLPTPDDEVKITYRLDGKGAIIAVDTNPIYSEWAARSHNLETVMAPDHPVRIGETWTYDFTTNPNTGAVPAHGAYKLVKVTEEFVIVQIEVHETEGIAPASCTGEITLRRPDFAPIALNLKLEDAAVPGLPGLGAGTLTRKPIRR